MARYTIDQLADINNRDVIKNELKEILEEENLLQTNHLENLFGFSSRAAQFVIKAIVLSAINGCTAPLTRKLLKHMSDYSWGSFDYSIVSDALQIEQVADTAYDMNFIMAGVLTGKE